PLRPGEAVEAMVEVARLRVHAGVDGDRHVDLLGRGPQRIVRRVAVRHAAQREGEEEAAPRAGAHGALELARRVLGVAEREVGDGDEAPAAPRAELLDPAVVGARVGERIAWVGRLGLPLEPEARVEERARDAIVIAEPETR